MKTNMTSEKSTQTDFPDLNRRSNRLAGVDPPAPDVGQQSCTGTLVGGTLIKGGVYLEVKKNIYIIKSSTKNDKSLGFYCKLENFSFLHQSFNPLVFKIQSKRRRKINFR